MTRAVHFDPFAYEFHEDPYPIYRALREHAPIYKNAEFGFWALSRHADVVAGFKDHERLCNSGGISLEMGDLGSDLTLVLSFLGMDPPRHTRMRGLVSRGFTPRRVAELEPRIRQMATAYIDRFIERGHCDFVAEFAGRLPMDVVSEMFGVPESDRDELRAWADTVLHRDEGVRGVPPEGVAASMKLLEYFFKLVASRRKRPGEDLASALLQVEVDGDRLDEKDIIAFCYLMIIAGNETTTKLLANALYWLEQNPAARAEVVANPALVPNWVEETLRYDNSTQLMARTATRDFELHGERIARGEKLLLLIGSANRDERVFAQPERFHIQRDTSESLAFGKGIHFCLGAALARLEGRVSLEEVMRRLPDYRVEASGIQRVHSTNVRGFSALPLAFTPARPR
jgi:cytochrome P450